MNKDELLTLCRKEEYLAGSRPWDTAYIWDSGRCVGAGGPPWDYCKILVPYVKQAKAFADVCTNGGALLASLAPLPFHTHATEVHLSNVDAARMRLSKLGVVVHPVSREDELPLKENYFDLAACHHARFDAQGLASIMRAQGVFVTEQIAGTDTIELNAALELRRPKTATRWTSDYAATQLLDAGFSIVEIMQFESELKFFDAGAVTYWVAGNAELFSGFSTERCANALFSLHRHIQTHEYIRAHMRRYLLIARKL